MGQVALMEKDEKLSEFEKELRSLINKFSMENRSNTPDFILSQYLTMCMVAWEAASSRREDWYGTHHKPAENPAPPAAIPSHSQRELRDFDLTWSKLLRIVAQHSGTNRDMCALNISIEDEMNLLVADVQVLGPQMAGEIVVRGVRAVFPFFHGFRTCWGYTETELVKLI